MRATLLYQILGCALVLACGDDADVKQMSAETQSAPSQEEVLNPLAPSPYLIYDKPVDLTKQPPPPQPPRAPAEQATTEPGEKGKTRDTVTVR